MYNSLLNHVLYSHVPVWYASATDKTRPSKLNPFMKNVENGQT